MEILFFFGHQPWSPKSLVSNDSCPNNRTTRSREGNSTKFLTYSESRNTSLPALPRVNISNIFQRASKCAALHVVIFFSVREERQGGQREFVSRGEQQLEHGRPDLLHVRTRYFAIELHKQAIETVLFQKRGDQRNDSPPTWQSSYPFSSSLQHYLR